MFSIPLFTLYSCFIEYCLIYKNITDSWRKIRELTGSYSTQCDKNTPIINSINWIRLVELAGTMLPVLSPPRRLLSRDSVCGTHIVAWMDNNHPSISDEIIARKLCFPWGEGCHLEYSSNINVGPCENTLGDLFDVYQLKKQQHCSYGYCCL